MMPETNDDKYAKDPRIPCKYGVKCYQKNPNHHEKYKHPQKTNIGAAKHSHKKRKAETTKKEIKEEVTKCDVSDSEDYTIDDNSSSSENNVEKPSSTLLDAEKNEDVKTKIKVCNDVSDSEESDDNTEPKEKQCKPSFGELHSSKHEEEENKGKKVQVKVANNTVKAESLDEQVKTENHSKDINKESKSPKYEDDKKQNCLDMSISDPKKNIKEKFLVDMPEDFYQLWEFCKKMKPSNPSQALKDVGLELVGPFDVLNGKFDNVKKLDEEYLIHWRYYHDPPEFQTVLKGDDNIGCHIGYVRDSPDELPVLLASNCARKNGIFHQMGGNIFSAVNIYLDGLKKSGDPFKKIHIGRIQSAIRKEAERLKIDLSQRTDKMVSREKKIVTRTFNKIGLVVPYDRKTQMGYRELAVSNKDLSTLFIKLQKALPEQKSKCLSDLQPVFTYASIATDECDFGTGIELGWNIIAHGVDSLDSTALRFLTTSYHLLKWEAFAKIAEAHLKHRKRGCNLSIV